MGTLRLSLFDVVIDNTLISVTYTETRVTKGDLNMNLWHGLKLNELRSLIYKCTGPEDKSLRTQVVFVADDKLIWVDTVGKMGYNRIGNKVMIHSVNNNELVTIARNGAKTYYVRNGDNWEDHGILSAVL